MPYCKSLIALGFLLAVLVSACHPKREPQAELVDSLDVKAAEAAHPVPDTVLAASPKAKTTQKKALFSKDILQELKSDGGCGSGSPMHQSVERSVSDGTGVGRLPPPGPSALRSDANPHAEGPGGGSPLSPSVEKGGFSGQFEVKPAGEAPDDSSGPASDTDPETE